MSKNAAPARGRRIGLRTVGLPADERCASQVVRTLLHGRYGGVRAAQLPAQVLLLLPAQGRTTGGLGQQTTEAGQDDDALLQGPRVGWRPAEGSRPRAPGRAPPGRWTLSWRAVPPGVQ